MLAVESLCNGRSPGINFIIYKASTSSIVSPQNHKYLFLMTISFWSIGEKIIMWESTEGHLPWLSVATHTQSTQKNDQSNVLTRLSQKEKMKNSHFSVSTVHPFILLYKIQSHSDYRKVLGNTLRRCTKRCPDVGILRILMSSLPSYR